MKGNSLKFDLIVKNAELPAPLLSVNSTRMCLHLEIGRAEKRVIEE